MNEVEDFNIDTKLRYLPIVEYLQKIGHDGETILEVGSGANGISDFTTQRVIGLDDDFSKTGQSKNVNITHNQGSITKLPYKSSSFKVVVCMDTFEHISLQDRGLALKELIRVTDNGGLLFLGFPTGGLNPFFENMINGLFKLVYKRDNPWLIEHKKYSLPTKDEVENELKKNEEIIYSVVGNVNVLVWFFSHLLFTILSPRKKMAFLNRSKAWFYKLGKLPIPPYYRSIYIVER